MVSFLKWFGHELSQKFRALGLCVRNTAWLQPSAGEAALIAKAISELICSFILYTAESEPET
jgi:hypothetical protein